MQGLPRSWMIGAVSVALAAGITSAQEAQPKGRFTAVTVESDQDRVACSADHGSVGRRGLHPSAQVCIIPFTDAGERCTDSEQCAGLCLVAYGGGGQTSTQNAVGRCQADNASVGCLGEVRQGQVDGFLCVD
jgi:hypothetical protein